MSLCFCELLELDTVVLSCLIFLSIVSTLQAKGGIPLLVSLVLQVSKIPQLLSHPSVSW
jgi:hypothetical protein